MYQVIAILTHSFKACHSIHLFKRVWGVAVALFDEKKNNTIGPALVLVFFKVKTCHTFPIATKF